MKFLNKQFTQETLKLALPVMLTQVGQVSVNLFDNIIVGKLLGAKALAAVSLGNAMFFSIFIFGLGFSLAIPPLVSEAHSQHDHNRINSIFRHGFVVNIILAAAFPLLVLYEFSVLMSIYVYKKIQKAEQKELAAIVTGKQIGRASCRERVCQYV